jgi:hypothetical protein
MHGISDFIDVTGSDTLLTVGKSSAGRMFGSLQIGNQRMHSGGRKKAGGIVLRNQGRTLDLNVSAALEKLDVFAAKFRTFHFQQAPVYMIESFLITLPDRYFLKTGNI